MRLLLESILPEAVRRGGIFALLFALIVSLASCGGGTNLDAVDGTAKTSGKTVPPVVLQQIAGVPPGKADVLSSALALAAGQRDIGIVEGGSLQSGNFSLNGNLRTQMVSAGVRVLYQWQLRDMDGVLVHTVQGDENAGLFTGTDAWAAVTPTVLERIAKATADSLAVRLSQLGYATRLAALDRPPPEYFVLAGEGAEREIDMALLEGSTGPEMAAFDGLGGEADVTDGAALADAGPAAQPEPEPVQTAKAAPAAPEIAEAPEAVAKAKPAKADAKFEIRAVAVLPVKGAGDGNDELTAAMRRTLAAAGWPVVSKPQADAITIIGKVRLSDVHDGAQDVSVRWEVSTPGGSQLGDVKQANRVPAGSFDRGWGDAAFAVAEAAASGIFDIVKRYQ